MSYKRKAEDKRRLRRLFNATKNSYGSGAYYDRYKGRLVRCSLSRNSDMPRYYKKQTSRRLRARRNFSDDSIALRHGDYRRELDYWWNIL